MRDARCDEMVFSYQLRTTSYKWRNAVLGFCGLILGSCFGHQPHQGAALLLIIRCKTRDARREMRRNGFQLSATNYKLQVAQCGSWFLRLGSWFLLRPSAAPGCGSTVLTSFNSSRLCKPSLGGAWGGHELASRISLPFLIKISKKIWWVRYLYLLLQHRFERVNYLLFSKLINCKRKFTLYY